MPASLPELELEEYEQARTPTAAKWANLGNEITDKLIGLIKQIAEIEGPVQRDVVIERLRKSYGLTKVKGSTRDHAHYFHGLFSDS